MCVCVCERERERETSKVLLADQTSWVEKDADLWIFESSCEQIGKHTLKNMSKI